MPFDYEGHKQNIPGYSNGKSKISLSNLTANLDAQYRDAKQRDAKRHNAQKSIKSEDDRKDVPNSSVVLRRVIKPGTLRNPSVDSYIEGEYEAPSSDGMSDRERELSDKVAQLERDLEAMRRAKGSYDTVDRLTQKMIEERCDRIMERWRNVSRARRAISNSSQYCDVPASMAVCNCVAQDWWDDTLPVCLLFDDPEYALWHDSFDRFQLLWDHGEAEFLKAEYPEYAKQYDENKEAHWEELQQQLDWCREYLPEPFKSRLPDHI